MEKKPKIIRTRIELLNQRKKDQIIYNMEKFGGVNKEALIMKLRELFRSIKSNYNPDLKVQLLKNKMYWKKKDGYCENPKNISRKSLLLNRIHNKMRESNNFDDSKDDFIDPLKKEKVINL